LGCHHEPQPDLVAGDGSKREVGEAAVFGLADMVLDARVTAAEVKV
jgi:hypothetical protein